MPDGRRLPTSVFGFLAVVILTVGGGWWVRAAPPSAPAAPAAVADDESMWPMQSVVVVPKGDGTVRTYVREPSTRSWQHRNRSTTEVMPATWPCRTSRDSAHPAVGSARSGLAATTGPRALRCQNRPAAR
jgi:hypothetical protein